jgi:hypothetical protein
MQLNKEQTNALSFETTNMDITRQQETLEDMAFQVIEENRDKRSSYYNRPSGNQINASAMSASFMSSTPASKMDDDENPFALKD